MFSSLILDIKKMSKEDKLSSFMPGQGELRRQKVKDLSSAIVAVDELVGFNIKVTEGNARVSGVSSKLKDKEEIKRKKFGGGT